jgi:hypothetical protein
MMHQRPVAIAIFIFFLLALPSVWAGTVDRSMPSTVGTGSQLLVTLVVDVDAGETFYAIDEQYPSGWVVYGNGGMNASQPGHLKIANISDASDTSFTYILTAPSSPGGHDWSGGIFMFEGMSTEASITGNDHVEVQAGCVPSTEVCDGADNDCDTVVDEGCDNDNDDYCNFSMVRASPYSCSGGNWCCPNGGGDCNDGNIAINPGATELCDGIDNDCDENIDEGVKTAFYRDSDVDGYGNPSDSVSACTQPSGYVANGQDCNDTDPSIKPGATEFCDTIDNDCNGVTDDVGGGNSVATTFCQCYGGGSPLAEEVCPHNNIDDDCNGAINDRDCGCTPGATQDCTKQSGVCSGSHEICPFGGEWLGCNDTTYLSHNSSYNATGDWPCDGLDNDCDGYVDEGLLKTYYRDHDSDNFGNSTDSIHDCSSTPPSGYVANGQDCNDNNNTINPDATEVCDWDLLGHPIDNNCDGRPNFESEPGDLGCPEYFVWIDADYYDGRTTNFSNVSDTTDIQGMILEKIPHGMIEFLHSVNISFSTSLNPPFTKIEHNLVDVDASALPFLDLPAEICLYNLDFLNPVIFMDGDVCPSSICEIIDYDGGNLTFNVTGFTEYSATGSCSDGTLYGECSSTQPRYCLNGSLVNRAGTCGCPSGYDIEGDNCVDNDGGGGGGGGGCTNGQKIACSVSGMCKPSYQTCVNGQFGTCHSDVLPEAEICDGLDNDCDGMVDDGITCLCTHGDTRPCGTDVGECVIGTATCQNGVWGECENEVMPSSELCDELDNDCDGIVDNNCTSDVCSEGAIPSGGCLCGGEKRTSGFCCSGAYFENGCPFAWSILILAGVIILIVLYMLVYYFKTKGQDLTWSAIKNRYGS